MEQIRRSILLVVGVSLSLLVLTMAWAPTPVARAADPNQVALVVKHPDGMKTKCIEFSEDEITGLDVLSKSGLDLVYEGYTQGAYICRIDNVGCDFPREACDCQFHAPDYLFWKYYKLENGSWEFYQVGSSGAKVQNGDVEGWVFAGGSAAGGGETPPDLSFEDICGSTSSDPTSTPSSGSSDDSDDDEEDLPTIDYFKADRTTVAAGENVAISWDLHDAEEAYLEAAGNRQGVIAPYVLTVNPTETTTYRLVAKNGDGEVDEEITITVSGTAAPTATATWTVEPVNQPVLPTATVPPPPTATTVPEVAAAAEPLPTNTPLPPMAWPSPTAEEASPTSTATPSGPPTPTWTPVPLTTATPVEVAMVGGDVNGGGGSHGGGQGSLLVRQTSGSGSTGVPVVVLAVVGGVAVIGGLGSLLLLFTSGRR